MIWQLALKFLNHLLNSSRKLRPHPTHHCKSVTRIYISALHIISWNTLGYLSNSLIIVFSFLKMGCILNLPYRTNLRTKGRNSLPSIYSSAPYNKLGPISLWNNSPYICSYLWSVTIYKYIYFDILLSLCPHTSWKIGLSLLSLYLCVCVFVQTQIYGTKY